MLLGYTKFLEEKLPKKVLKLKKTAIKLNFFKGVFMFYLVWVFSIAVAIVCTVLVGYKAEKSEE